MAFAASAETPPPSAAVDAVRDTLARVRTVALTDQPEEQKVAALRELARRLIDTHEMGRRAIGTRLAAQPAAEQEEFLNLFDDVVVRTYVTRLLFFPRPRFTLGKEEVGDHAVLVHTHIVTDNDKFAVDYEMHHRNDTWMASDIIIEGIGLTQNYAEQFDGLLRSRSFEQLLDLMRSKVAGLRAKGAS
jgi:phospholipid transport system substrate-binding protein